MVVTDKLIEHFPDVVDVNFTAHMEDELDDIAEGGIGQDAGAARVQRAVRARAREGRALVRALRGGAGRALPALSEGGPRAGQAPGQARPLRQVHRLPELPGVPLHPQHGRQRAPRARCCSTRSVPSAATHKLQERVGRFGPFVGCSGYPECRYIKKDPPVSTGVTCPECNQGELVGAEEPLRRAVLQLRPLPRVHARGEQPADQGSPVPAVRLAAAAAAEERQVLELRRRARPGLQRHEGRRRRGRGGGPRGQGGGARSARREEEAGREEAGGEAEDGRQAEDGREARSRAAKKTPARRRSRRSPPCPTHRRPSGSWPASPTRSPHSAEPSRRPSRTS